MFLVHLSVHKLSTMIMFITNLKTNSWIILKLECVFPKHHINHHKLNHINAINFLHLQRCSNALYLEVTH